MRANSLALRRCVTRTVVTTCSRGDLGRNFSPGPHGPAGRGQGRKSLVVPTQSLSIPNNGSLTDSLGIETELGRDLSSVPNRELGQFRALVLDVSYRPLDTVPWTRAIVLDYFDKVDVLEYYESFVRSAKDMHFLPAVIRVKFYVDNRRKIKSAFDKGVPLTRKNVYARDRHQCVYCSSTKDLTLDHVVPRSKGGGTTWENLVTACSKCNQKKGDKLLKELKGRMKLKGTPKRPSHYEMSSYMVARQEGNAPKEWADYLPPGTAEYVFNKKDSA